MSPPRMLIVFVAAFALAACGVFGNRDAPERLRHLQSGAGWSLLTMHPDTSGVLQAPAGQRYTLRFSAHSSSFSGQSACNQYGGEYRATADGSMRIDRLVSTEAYCGDGHEFMVAYQQILRAAEHYRFDDEHLVLRAQNGTLEFTSNAD